MITKRIAIDEYSYMDAYIADETKDYTRKAMLVIPGGGYYEICSDSEGEPVALAFLSHGFNRFVLHYAVERKKAFPIQLIEASTAIKHIKDNAAQYGIDKSQVFAVGFSAGGHLAASLAVLWNMPEIYDALDMPYGYNKPKGVILAYPVITGFQYAHKASIENLLCEDAPSKNDIDKVCIERHVSADSIPIFAVHAANDDLVPVQNSLMIARAYADKSIPFELHIYPRGGHGFALGNEVTWEGKKERLSYGISDWIDNAVRWSENLKACNE